MDKKDFPIHARWRWKVIVGTIVREIIPISAVGGVILYFLFLDVQDAWKGFLPIIGFLVFVTIFPPIITLWREKKFLYSFDEKFIVLHQGIISKAQRNIPYGVIQHVVVKQDFLDRLFGIATLQIENASEGGGNVLPLAEKKRWLLVVGFKDNKIVIPGLFPLEAETLKKHILTKMKESKSRSGGL